MAAKPSRPSKPSPLAGWTLRFLYVGSADVGKDLAAYKAAGGAVVWDKTAFGTRVAAVRMGPDPLILLAGHRPSPSLLPVFQVDDLKASVKALRKAGWTIEGEEFEVPNGPCRLVKDPSGNELTLLQETRPDPFGTE
jgi:predicted enzyme related to lactoylglutathione lyase